MVAVLLTLGPIRPAVSGADIGALLELSLEELSKTQVSSAARREQEEGDSPRFVTVVTAEEIQRKNYRTVPEALSESAGVFVQHTNYGGGAPIIRGLVGNQILLMVDGVRLNNAIYRLGPNQYLNTIDINQVERIEVVHGAGSILYGSDAMGGLIHVFTKSYKRSGAASEFSGRLFGRVASTDRSGVGRLEAGTRHGPVSILAGVSVKSFGDLRGGGGFGRQRFTGYDEQDGDLKLTIDGGGRQRLVLLLQQLVQVDVPRTDRMASGADLEFEWDPQTRQLAALQYELDLGSSFAESLKVGVSYQEQAEEIEQIRAASPELETRTADEVQSVGVTIQLNSSVGERQILTWGADLYSDAVFSRGEVIDLRAGGRVPSAGRFADGARYRSAGAFVQDEIQISEPLSVTLGGRYSLYHLHALANGPGTGTVPVDAATSAVTGSAYGLYRLPNGVGVFFGVAQGFRAPNVDDSTVLGSFGGGLEVPNPDLKPERSLNYEVGVKGKHHSLMGRASYFVSNYRGLIERGPGTFGGLPYFDANGNNRRDLSEDAVFQRGNSGQARIHGAEAQMAAKLGRDWTLSGNVAWTKGSNRLTGDPLRRIPPVFGFAGLRWRPHADISVEFYNSVAGAQKRLAPGDIRDPRIAAGGTPGFVTFNIRAGLTIQGLGLMTLDIANLTNRRYRRHGSGIDSRGFGVVMGLQRRF